ncbi:hypothetical protein AM593_10733, partial [Mytilus galloprovincialis]
LTYKDKMLTCRRYFCSSEKMDALANVETLSNKINQTSEICNGTQETVTDIVMMDDGRLVMCIPSQRRLLISNTDGSQVDSIPVQGYPYSVTAVSNSTVALTLLESRCIEMYDINNKLKLKSISQPGGLWRYSGITTINNKLVVRGENCLLIIDYQTGEVIQTIKIDCDPDRLHSSGDRIFYCDINLNTKKLYCYSNTNDTRHTLTLPSNPFVITTLQDG